MISTAKGTFVRDFYVDLYGNISIEKNTSQDKENLDIIYNTPNKGRFRLIKADSTDRALLGAKFKLTDPNDYSEERVSDDNGYIEFNDLSIGEYTLEELEAPKGYIKSEQKWTITVSEDGSTTIKAKDKDSDTDAVVAYSEIRYLNNENKSKLNSKGYLIADEKKATEEDQTANSATIKVLNRKPSMPQTGGAGTKIAFAIIGTAVMLAGIAYFGIFQNDKNKRKSVR